MGQHDPLGFGGQFGYYTDTGLLCLTHRYYDPGTGKSINRDPIGYAGGANLYGFCGGNPVNNADPSGYDYYVVLVHGTARNGESHFGNDFLATVKAKYHVDASHVKLFDWTEGHSFGGTANPYSVKSAGPSLANFLNSLPNSDTKSPNTIDLIGYSNGGNVCLFALDGPTTGDYDNTVIMSVTRLGSPIYGESLSASSGRNTQIYNVYDPKDRGVFGVSGLVGGANCIPANSSNWHNIIVSRNSELS